MKTKLKSNQTAKESTNNQKPSETTPVNKPTRKPELTQEEIYKLQKDISNFFMGKTQSEIEAVLGTGKKNDQDGYSQEFSLKGAQIPIENFPNRYTTITFQFDAPTARGGKVKYVNVW